MTAMIATRPLTRTTSAGEAGERGRVWLDCLFAGDFSFPAIPPVGLPPGERGAVEHDAISRAAGCRDLFVLHADPPAGERGITDLTRATADRVLILSPNPAAADRITERLLKCGVPVLRALADDENPTRPSPAVSKVTSAAIAQASVEQAKKETAASVAAAEERLAAFGIVAKAIARLAEVNDRLKQLDAEIAEQTARRDRIEADVRGETRTPLAAALTQLQADHDDATAKFTSELTALTMRHTVLTEERHKHAEATRKPGFFARLFGSRPKHNSLDAAELEKLVQALEAEATALTARMSELQTRLDAAASAFVDEREKLLSTEIATRRSSIDATLTAAESERERARTEAAALNKVIDAAVPGEDYAAAERQLATARQRAAEVVGCAAEIVTRAVAEPRVVVGIPGSLESDPVFAGLPDDPPFGLLILDRAEELPEAEFPRLARLAERWVLVGEALHPEPRSPQNGRAPGRNGRPIEVPFVARLAKLLDRETWALEAERLVCRLVHLSPDQRRNVTREPLVDRPEIELRFTASDADPLLAEIAFPAGTSVPAAKSFLFHTLGEVLLRPCGEVQWKHGADAITALWPLADAGRDAEWIELEPGVREKVVGAGLFAFTAAVSFDPTTWDAEKAEAWLTNRLPPPATGRFAALPRSPGPRAVS